MELCGARFDRGLRMNDQTQKTAHQVLPRITRFNWRYLTYAIALILFDLGQLHAQLPNKVGSLLNMERSLAAMARENTPYEALLSVTDSETIYFAPGPVEGLRHMKNRPNIADVMRWEPSFSGIGKSMEFGFTTGALEFQRVGSPVRHGEYLTIWKRDRKGDWKILVRGVSENYGRKNQIVDDALPNAAFIEPDSLGYLRHRSQVRLNQRKDVVASNEQLFATILRSDNAVAFDEFLADDVWLIFPWREPIQGKREAIDFLTSTGVQILTEMEEVDRAYSGELAYSHGTANFWKDGVRDPHNYIRVWQRQPDHQWRVIIEFYSER